MFQNTFDLALLLTLLDRLALIVFMLSLSQAQQYFGIAMLDIHFQRNQRNPLGRQLTGNLFNLFFMQQQLTIAQRIMIKEGAVVILTDMHVHQP